MVWSN